MDRLVFLDIAKVVAIIMVVIGHWGTDTEPQQYTDLVKFIYLFHMPLFMIASGYLWSATSLNRSYSSIVAGKFKRLMIPYLSISTVFIGIKMVSQLFISIETPVDFFSYFRMLYLPEAAFLLWFVYTLFLFFLFVPLFRFKGGAIVLLILSIILHFLPVDFPQMFCLKQIKIMLIYFATGWCSKDIILYISKLSYYRLLMLTGFLVGMLLSSLFLPSVSWLRVVQALLGSFSVIALSKIFESNRLLIYIGTYSTTIYFFHTLCMGPFKYVLTKYNDDSVFYFICMTMFVVSAGVILPILLQRHVINKSKILRQYILGER